MTNFLHISLHYLIEFVFSWVGLAALVIAWIVFSCREHDPESDALIERIKLQSEENKNY